jgi:hypothetical protein
MPAHQSMSRDPIAAFAQRQDWIKPELEQIAQQSIQGIFRSLGPVGESLLSLLHGNWLHEPLHAVLTDVPIGAWTVTIICDLMGAVTESNRWDRAADASLAVGLVGAAGAAVTGMVDWSEVDREAPRRKQRCMRSSTSQRLRCLPHPASAGDSGAAGSGDAR